jgi:hypothetical protein
MQVIKIGERTDQTFECSISAPVALPAANTTTRHVIVCWPGDVVPLDRFDVFGVQGRIATAWIGDTLSATVKARRLAIAERIVI